MIKSIKTYKNSLLYKAIILCLLFSFGLMSIAPQEALSQTLAPAISNTLIPLSPAFTPTLVRGIRVYPDNPLKFDFIVDSGDSGLQGDELKSESEKLIRYFLASLTLPENDLWVNLSPYEKDRIVPQELGTTEMGIDMLAQDYLLKQITASLTNPDSDLGKEFWAKIYKQSYEKFGTTNVPVDTFNKVWIMPDKAEVYVQEDKAFVVESRLKVMLEQDYLAIQQAHSSSLIADSKTSEPRAKSQELASQIVREVFIPVLEKEVNEGKNFAQLRQIYNSIILSYWYKTNLKNSILNKVYADKRKVKGLEVVNSEKYLVSSQKSNEESLENGEEKHRILDTRYPSQTQNNSSLDTIHSSPDTVQIIYQQYLQTFKKGVCNMMKVEYDPYTKKNIPRKYFAGGVTTGDIEKVYKETGAPTAGSALIRNFKKATLITLISLMLLSDPVQANMAADANKKMIEDIIEMFEESLGPEKAKEIAYDYVNTNPELRDKLLADAIAKALRPPDGTIDLVGMPEDFEDQEIPAPGINLGRFSSLEFDHNSFSQDAPKIERDSLREDAMANGEIVDRQIIMLPDGSKVTIDFLPYYYPPGGRVGSIVDENYIELYLSVFFDDIENISIDMQDPNSFLGSFLNKDLFSSKEGKLAFLKEWIRTVMIYEITNVNRKKDQFEDNKFPDLDKLLDHYRVPYGNRSYQTAEAFEAYLAMLASSRDAKMVMAQLFLSEMQIRTPIHYASKMILREILDTLGYKKFVFAKEKEFSENTEESIEKAYIKGEYFHDYEMLSEFMQLLKDSEIIQAAKDLHRKIFNKEAYNIDDYIFSFIKQYFDEQWPSKDLYPFNNDTINYENLSANEFREILQKAINQFSDGFWTYSPFNEEQKPELFLNIIKKSPVLGLQNFGIAFRSLNSNKTRREFADGLMLIFENNPEIVSTYAVDIVVNNLDFFMDKASGFNNNLKKTPEYEKIPIFISSLRTLADSKAPFSDVSEVIKAALKNKHALIVEYLDTQIDSNQILRDENHFNMLTYAVYEIELSPNKKMKYLKVLYDIAINKVNDFERFKHIRALSSLVRLIEEDMPLLEAIDGPFIENLKTLLASKTYPDYKMMRKTNEVNVALYNPLDPEYVISRFIDAGYTKSTKDNLIVLTKTLNGKNVTVTLDPTGDADNYQGQIFKLMLDPKINIISYSGHAGMGATLLFALYQAPDLKDNLQAGSKIIALLACYSAQNYLTQVMQKYQYSHFFGTLTDSYMPDDTDALLNLLEGYSLEESWEEISRRISEQEQEAYGGRVEYISPNNEELLDYLDLDGDGYPDGKNRAENIYLTPLSDIFLLEQENFNYEPGGNIDEERIVSNKVGIVTERVKHFFRYNDLLKTFSERINPGTFERPLQDQQNALFVEENRVAFQDLSYDMNVNLGYRNKSEAVLIMMSLWEANKYFSGDDVFDQVRGLQLVAEFVKYFNKEHLFPLFLEKYKLKYKGITLSTLIKTLDIYKTEDRIEAIKEILKIFNYKEILSEDELKDKLKKEGLLSGSAATGQNLTPQKDPIFKGVYNPEAIPPGATIEGYGRKVNNKMIYYPLALGQDWLSPVLSAMVNNTDLSVVFRRSPKEGLALKEGKNPTKTEEVWIVKAVAPGEKGKKAVASSSASVNQGSASVSSSNIVFLRNLKQLEGRTVSFDGKEYALNIEIEGESVSMYLFDDFGRRTYHPIVRLGIDSSHVDLAMIDIFEFSLGSVAFSHDHPRYGNEKKAMEAIAQGRMEEGFEDLELANLKEKDPDAYIKELIKRQNATYNKNAMNLSGKGVEQQVLKHIQSTIPQNSFASILVRLPEFQVFGIQSPYAIFYDEKNDFYKKLKEDNIGHYFIIEYEEDRPRAELFLEEGDSVLTLKELGALLIFKDPSFSKNFARAGWYWERDGDFLELDGLEVIEELINYQNEAREHYKLVSLGLKKDDLLGFTRIDENGDPMIENFVFQIILGGTASAPGIASLNMEAGIDHATIRKQEKSLEEKGNVFIKFLASGAQYGGLHPELVKTVFLSFSTEIEQELLRIKTKWYPNDPRDVWALLMDPRATLFKDDFRKSEFLYEILRGQSSKIIRYPDEYLALINSDEFLGMVKKAVTQHQESQKPQEIRIGLVGAGYGQEAVFFPLLVQNKIREICRTLNAPESTIRLKVNVYSRKNKITDKLKKNEILYPKSEVIKALKSTYFLAAKNKTKPLYSEDEIESQLKGFLQSLPDDPEALQRTDMLNDILSFHDVDLVLLIDVQAKSLEKNDILLVHNVFQYLRPKDTPEETWENNVHKAFVFLDSIASPGAVISVVNQDNWDSEVFKAYEQQYRSGSEYEPIMPKFTQKMKNELLFEGRESAEKAFFRKKGLAMETDGTLIDANNESTGGIDFNAKNMNVEVRTEGIKDGEKFQVSSVKEGQNNLTPNTLNMTQSDSSNPFILNSSSPIFSGNFEGLFPVIISITPVTNFYHLLGLSQEENPEALPQPVAQGERILALQPAEVRT